MARILVHHSSPLTQREALPCDVTIAHKVDEAVLVADAQTQIVTLILDSHEVKSLVRKYYGVRSYSQIPLDLTTETK